MYGCGVVMGLGGTLSSSVLGMLVFGVCGVIAGMSSLFSVWWGLFVSGVVFALKFSQVFLRWCLFCLKALPSCDSNMMVQSLMLLLICSGFQSLPSCKKWTFSPSLRGVCCRLK